MIVNGPFYSHDEEAPLLAELPPGVEPRRVRLLASYDVALDRVTNDAMPRNFSKDPAILRPAHDRFARKLAAMPAADWTFDTAEVAADGIAAAIALSLVADPPDD